MRSSKIYKGLLAKTKNRARKDFEKKLRNCRSKDPKAYWSILNVKGKRSNDRIPVETVDMFRFFKDLNKVDLDDTEELNLNDLEYVEASRYLNKPFSEAEIRKAAKSLKSGKSCGDDGVLNEYIKASLDVLTPIYVNLFN